MAPIGCPAGNGTRRLVDVIGSGLAPDTARVASSDPALPPSTLTKVRITSAEVTDTEPSEAAELIVVEWYASILRVTVPPSTLGASPTATTMSSLATGSLLLVQVGPPSDVERMVVWSSGGGVGGGVGVAAGSANPVGTCKSPLK